MQARSRKPFPPLVAVVAQTSTEYSADLYTDSDFLLNADGSLSDVTIRQFAKQV